MGFYDVLDQVLDLLRHRGRVTYRALKREFQLDDDFLTLGPIPLKIGRPEQARPELSATIDLYRAMEMTFWLPQAEAALARVEES